MTRQQGLDASSVLQGTRAGDAPAATWCVCGCSPRTPSSNSAALDAGSRRMTSRTCAMRGDLNLRHRRRVCLPVRVAHAGHALGEGAATESRKKHGRRFRRSRIPSAFLTGLRFVRVIRVGPDSKVDWSVGGRRRYRGVAPHDHPEQSPWRRPARRPPPACGRGRAARRCRAKHVEDVPFPRRAHDACEPVRELALAVQHAVAQHEHLQRARAVQTERDALASAQTPASPARRSLTAAPADRDGDERPPFSHHERARTTPTPTTRASRDPRPRAAARPR